MSQISQTSIIQGALRHLQEVPMMSPQDNRPVTRALKDAYDVARDTMLRRHLWNFATRQALLNPDAVKPPFGWANAYPLPADCIMLYPVTDDGSFDGTIIPHTRQGKAVLANFEGGLPVTYVARVTEDFFTADFAEALSAWLALKVSQAVTSKVTFTEMLGKLAGNLAEVAVANDRQENRQRFKNPILKAAYNLVFSGKDAMASDADSLAYDLRLQYEEAIQGALELHPWNFATQREVLVADAERPTFGFRYRYAKPVGMLRLAQPTLDGVWQAPNVTHRIEGDWIVSDIGPKLFVEYVASVTDPEKMSASFRRFAAAHLALSVVSGTTRANLVQFIAQERAMALDTARMNDSVQGTMQAPEADYWEKARFGEYANGPFPDSRGQYLDDGRGGGWDPWR